MSNPEGSKAISMQLGPSRLPPHRYPDQLLRSLLGGSVVEGIRRLLESSPLDERQRAAFRNYLQTEGVLIQIRQGSAVRALTRESPLSREVFDPDSDTDEIVVGVSRPMKGGAGGWS